MSSLPTNSDDYRHTDCQALYPGFITWTEENLKQPASGDKISWSRIQDVFPQKSGEADRRIVGLTAYFADVAGLGITLVV